MKAFEAAVPVIGGPFVSKALFPTGHVTADFDGRVVHDPMAAFSLLAAVNSRQVDTPAGTYLRQTQRVSNAATVDLTEPIWRRSSPRSSPTASTQRPLTSF